MTPRNTIKHQHPALGNLVCIPHKGEVNDSWQPIDDAGELFRPGLRVCGFKDCISPKHIAVDQSVSGIVKQVFKHTQKLMSVPDAKKILQQASK
jgi:hypothetical protein